MKSASGINHPPYETADGFAQTAMCFANPYISVESGDEKELRKYRERITRAL